MQHIISELNKLSLVIAPVFYKLLFISITGALVGGVILVVRKFFDKKIPPVWKYLMWAVVVLALLIPFRMDSDIALTQNISRIEDISFREEYDIARLEMETDFQAPSMTDMEKVAADDLQSKVNTLFWKSTIFDVVIPLTWLFGMCFAFLFFIGNKIYLSYKIKKSSLKSNRFDEILAKCKSQLGITKNVEIVLQDYVKSPALIGLINPKILLPIYTESMSEESLYYVLLHELSHYKRKDMLVNYVLLAAQAVHWFNPLVWLLFKFIREDMELLNDSYVLKAVGEEQNTAYAKSLVEVLGLSHNVSLMPKLICMVDGKKNVERRISMIKLGEAFNKHRIIVAVCCLAVICVVCGLFLTKKNDAVEKTTNELLFENRTEYVGDNSKVGGILSALTYPEKVIYENFALHTTEPPYAITVNFKTDTETRDFYSREAAQGAFQKIAFTMFSLIGNVEQVNFSLDDGANPYDFTVYRSQANSLLGDDYFNRTQALEGLQEVLKDIEEKVGVNYGEIRDDFVEKSEFYSINPDMPNGDIQLTIQNTTEFPYFGDKNEGFAYFEKAANQLHFGIITSIGQPVATDENPVGSLAGAGVKFDYDVTSNELSNVEFTDGAEGQRLDITDSELIEVATKMLQYISEDNSQSAKAIIE